MSQGHLWFENGNGHLGHHGPEIEVPGSCCPTETNKKTIGHEGVSPEKRKSNESRETQRRSIRNN